MSTLLLLVSKLTEDNLFCDKVDLLVSWSLPQFDKECCAKVAATYAFQLFKLFLITYLKLVSVGCFRHRGRITLTFHYKNFDRFL